MHGTRNSVRHPASAAPLFNTQTFLDWAGVARTVVRYARGDAIVMQRDACPQHVVYIPAGRIKLSVVSKTGRVAVVAGLRSGAQAGGGEMSMASGVWYFASLTPEQVAAGHVGVIQRLFADAINGVIDPRGACLFVASDATGPDHRWNKAKRRSSIEAGTVFFSPASIALVPHLIAHYHAHPGPPPARASAALLVGEAYDWDLLPQPSH